MKFKIKKSNAAIIIILIAFTIISVYFALHRPPQEPVGNIFICAKQAVPFRANISDCRTVEMQPSENPLTDVLTSPAASSAAILVDPAGSADVGNSAYEIYKTMDSLEPRTFIVPIVAYTQPWADQPGVPVLSIENATYEQPIIWLKPNQSKTLVEVNGPQITIYAQTQYDLDAAACKVAILLIEEVMGC